MPSPRRRPALAAQQATRGAPRPPRRPSDRRAHGVERDPQPVPGQSRQVGGDPRVEGVLGTGVPTSTRAGRVAALAPPHHVQRTHTQNTIQLFYDDLPRWHDRGWSWATAGLERLETTRPQKRRPGDANPCDQGVDRTGVSYKHTEPHTHTHTQTTPEM